jgi:hypothetical protein
MFIRFKTSIAQLILHGYSNVIAISKSKLALSEYNITYLSAIAFIVFMLH